MAPIVIHICMHIFAHWKHITPIRFAPCSSAPYAHKRTVHISPHCTQTRVAPDTPFRITRFHLATCVCLCASFKPRFSHTYICTYVQRRYRHTHTHTYITYTFVSSARIHIKRRTERWLWNYACFFFFFFVCWMTVLPFLYTRLNERKSKTNNFIKRWNHYIVKKLP